MKKIIALLLAVIMVFAITACAADKPAASPDPVTPVVDTKILKEADDKMLNTYSVLAVNPDAPFVDADGNSVEGVAVNTEGR